MACTRVNVRALGKKKYSAVPQEPRKQTFYITNQNLEIESVVAKIEDSDQVTVPFGAPFSNVPSIVVMFVSNEPAGNVSAYVETATTTEVTVRTSAPVTGRIHVRAMYIDSCGPVSYISP